MQQIYLAAAPSGLHDDGTAGFTTSSRDICFRHVWDSEAARFSQCFLPVISGLPAALGFLIVLVQLLRVLIRWRPQWTRPFVLELAVFEVEIDLVLTRRWTAFTLWLTMLCGMASAFQFAGAVLVWSEARAFLPVLGWVVALLEILIFRPRTVPFAVLTVLITQVVTISILLENNWWTTRPVVALNSCSLGCGALALILLLFMPLRDPFLSTKDISQPFSRPTSVLRSPEEALNIWQFMTVAWMKPLMQLGSARQLENEDVWNLPYEFQHRRLHENFRELRGTVIARLLAANGVDLMIVTLLGLAEQLLQYAAPVFLQLILSSMENPDIPTRVPLTYAALGLCARLVAAQIGVFSLWFGRRCYERSRGEMITMLYEKTLARKIAFSKEGTTEPKDSAEPSANGHTSHDGDTKEIKTFWTRVRSRLKFFAKTPKPPTTKDSASMGKILNLMRNDVYEVAQRFWEFDNLIKKPLAIILSVSLVVSFLGWSSMMAVVLVILAQVMNYILVRVIIYYEKKRRLATDTKLQIITQFVEAIRHLRWYGWQEAWLSQVLSARQKELSWRIVTWFWGMAIAFVNTLAYDLVPVAAFATYTIIAKKQLTIDIAFPALQLCSMMTAQLRDLPTLITALINAWVAVCRIEDFMAEADREEMATEALIGDKLAVDGATFAWPGLTKPILNSVDISFPEGLSVVCGEVASGKTALLQALLGEMDMLEGQLIRPPEPIGYCAQTPWLQSMSIRDNILFSAEFDEQRYKAVLDACALTPDLAEFKAGDLSLIGENGIGLSGGQRARVALARAVYSRTKILLLDDPLAALDQQTAETIVQKCFSGSLLRGRTVVLVTHRTDLVLDIADQVIKIHSGKAALLDHDEACADEQLMFRPKKQSDDQDEDDPAKLDTAAAVPDKFIEDEHRAYGGVQARVYWEYIKAGALRFWALCILTLVIYRLVAVTEVWFIKEWGERYSTSAKSKLHVYHEDAPYTTSQLFGKLPAPEDNIRPWLLGFFLLAFGQSLAYIASQGMLLVIVYTAAKNMFRDIMEKVAYATFRFYDVTPVGRLMNRMTSDIGVIDGGISQQFAAISWMMISWTSAIIVIASITPTFLLFTLVLLIAFIWIFRQFIPTSQNLRRLEMVSLTPLMSNFGELLNGLATVRAFHAQSRFQDRVIHVVDTFQKMDHFYWSLQAWLSYRYDILSAFATFVLFLLAVATNLSAGLTAFALLSASKLVTTTHGLCRQYGQLQMEFVSVERVVELTHLEQEPKGSVEPPAWWPSFSGDIIFKNVTIKYAPHLDPALANVTFTIKGGSKTAVIGRTGSGKSTLAIAMLATIVPESGHILIDNVDLAEVNKQLLRTRVTFLAQDPVLFPGSMRQNLDPIDEHTDSECELVLDRVCGRQGWKLDTVVEAGGKNLSQGQRQLVGLARAVLRRSAIVILDEATASIDRETATQIQQVIQEDMKDSTVITIAHRLEAVRNADYCIVLGKGKVLEQGTAEAMLKEQGGKVTQNIDEEEV